MDAGIDFAKVAPFLQHPLVLAGFALLVVFGLFRAFLKSDRRHPASGEATGRILALVARYGFILALAVVLLGFALEFYKQSHPRVVLDPDAIVAAVERQALEKNQLQQQLAGSQQEVANLRRTVGELTRQAKQGEGPSGLTQLLARVADGGDTRELESSLTAFGDKRAAERREANREAAKAFRQAGALARWRDTAASLDAYRRATDLDPSDPWAWIERGRLEVQFGKLDAAARSFGRAQDAAQDDRTRFVTLLDTGDVRVSQGDLAGALGAYQAGLVISERLASSDPGNAGWQRDLSVIHDRIGDVRVSQGDLAGALGAYQAGLVISERLASSDPGNAGWQRDLIVSCFRLGDLHARQGDGAGAALGYFRRALLIVRAQTAAGKWFPTDAKWEGVLVGRIATLERDTAAAR